MYNIVDEMEYQNITHTLSPESRPVGTGKQGMAQGKGIIELENKGKTPSTFAQEGVLFTVAPA